MMIKVKESLAN